METNLERRIKKAISIYPQSFKNVNYLFGGDAGVSLALDGNIYLRSKNTNHEETDITVKTIDLYSFKHGHYSRKFEETLGTYQKYDSNNLKRLKGLPDDLLDSTFENVHYHNNNYLIPQLEILFLDCYLNGEKDIAEKLMKTYDLNIRTILMYYSDNYMNPILNKYQMHSVNIDYYKVVIEIYHLIKRIATHELATHELATHSFSNQKVNEVLNRTLKEIKLSKHGLKGLPSDYFIYPITLEKDLSLSLDDRLKIEENIIACRKNQIEKFENEITDINNMYANTLTTHKGL